MDWTMLTPILNLAAIVFAAGGIFFTVKSLDKRMGSIEVEMKQLVAVMVLQARHEERMNSTDQRVLAQGKRLDDFVHSQAEAQERMARMVESTISRVNAIADRGFKPAIIET